MPVSLLVGDAELSEEPMKVKWKIAIGILALLAVLASVTSLFYLGLSPMMPMPDGIECPYPSPPSSVDRLLYEMEFGTIAFNAPTNINIDDSPQIQLILSLAETVEKLKQSITEEGEKVGATIRVSDRMKACLSGYMFQITAITSEIQAVSKSQQTEIESGVHLRDQSRHR